MKPVSVLVIIVNYRTPALAVEAAAALEGEVAARGDAHVVIVDNGSDDGSADAIGVALAARGFSGWCSLLAEPRNGGFAAGNNAGLRWHKEATGDYPAYAWLLNPDTVAEPGALGALVDFLQAHPDVGIAGSRCLERDGTVWPSAFRFMNAKSELNAAVNFGPVTRLLGNPVIAPPQPAEPAPAQWVSGTSMMVRRAVIERIGLMDEGYFLYFEETDYCARAAEAGYASWTVPASRVVHIGGQATGVTGEARARRRRPRYWFASRARFFIHQYGVARTHLANFAWLAGYPVGLLIGRLRGQARADPPHFWRDFLAAYYGPGGIMYQPGKRAATMGDRLMGDMTIHPSSDPATRPQSDVDLGRFNRNPPGIAFAALIREDYATHGRDLFSQGFWAIAVHRFGNWRMAVKSNLLRAPLTLLYRILAKHVQWWCGIDLTYTVTVGRRVRIWHQGGMTLEALEIGDDVHIRQNTTFGLRQHGDPRWLKPIIGAGCQIGAGAVIVGPIVVGAGSTIGANVVLAQDVPARSIVTVPKPVVRPLQG